MHITSPSAQGCMDSHVQINMGKQALRKHKPFTTGVERYTQENVNGVIKQGVEEEINDNFQA